MYDCDPIVGTLVFFTATRGLAVDPRDGRLLWSYDRANNNTANVATPVVKGNRVFFSSDYGTGAALVDVRAAGNFATANEVYFTREMRNHHASSVLVGTRTCGPSPSTSGVWVAVRRSGSGSSATVTHRPSWAIPMGTTS